MIAFSSPAQLLSYPGRKVAGVGPRRLGLYAGIDLFESVLFLEVGQKFIVLTYQAWDAHGLIGPEHNGIAVLDDTRQSVLCDEIGRESSGYYGISAKQWKLACRLLQMSWEEFRCFINEHPRARYQI